MLGHRLLQLFSLFVVPLATFGKLGHLSSARFVVSPARVALKKKTLEVPLYP
jgi:hypothetical protein